jgi:hypothetical protein
MKTEIITKPTKPTNTINIDTDSLVIPLGSVIVAEVRSSNDETSKYILNNTGRGYIFQYWNAPNGHSGWSPTVEQAISSAFNTVPRPKVYMYSTLEEAITDFFFAA